MLQTTYRGREQYEQQLQLSDLSMRMREKGILVSRAAIDRHRRELESALLNQRTKFEQLVSECHVVRGKELKTRTHIYVGPYRLGETGMHSDLRRLFFGHFGIRPTSFTEEGQPSLNDDALMVIAQAKTRAGAAAREVLKYREYATLKSRYVDGLRIFDDDRIHAEWKCWGTKTFRFASRNPNCQNLPDGKRQKLGVLSSKISMRDILISDPGKFFVKTDVSSLELIIQALLAGDDGLIEWYNAGKSGYLETAKIAYKCPDLTKKDPHYDIFKRVILALNYGSGAQTIWEQMLPATPGLKLQVVKQTIDAWWTARPALFDWRKNHLQKCRDQGYVEAELSGLRHYFDPNDMEPTKVLNLPMQANAAKIMNDAILAVDDALDHTQDYISLQIHDELVTQTSEPKRVLEIHRNCMEQVVTLGQRSIKLKTESAFGTNYKDMVAFT